MIGLVRRTRVGGERAAGLAGPARQAREAVPGDRAVAAALAGPLERLGLSRLLCLTVAGAIPPLWYEIALLHYRGSFHSRFMWAPLLYLPLEMLAGLLAAAVDRRETRGAFRALSWGTVALGTGGSLLHLRGVRRQMGGLREWRYNLVTGPPLPAPLQVALFGLIGVLGAGSGRPPGVTRRLRAIEVAGQLLLAIEAGYAHRQNYYANPAQYVPVTLAPALALAQAAAAAPIGPVRRAGRRLEGPLSLAAALSGLIGLGFHAKNVRGRTGGFSWQNLFYGAPLVAPLQLAGQGLLGLLAAHFDRGR